MARVEVITDPVRRRCWTQDRKRAIVAERLAPGAVANAAARRAAICRGKSAAGGKSCRLRRRIGDQAGERQYCVT
jgi:hypothetical protein